MGIKVSYLISVSIVVKLGMFLQNADKEMTTRRRILGILRKKVTLKMSMCNIPLEIKRIYS